MIPVLRYIAKQQRHPFFKGWFIGMRAILTVFAFLCMTGLPTPQARACPANSCNAPCSGLDCLGQIDNCHWKRCYYNGTVGAPGAESRTVSRGQGDPPTGDNCFSACAHYPTEKNPISTSNGSQKFLGLSVPLDTSISPSICPPSWAGIIPILPKKNYDLSNLVNSGIDKIIIPNNPLMVTSDILKLISATIKIAPELPILPCADPLQTCCKDDRALKEKLVGPSDQVGQITSTLSPTDPAIAAADYAMEVALDHAANSDTTPKVMHGVQGVMPSMTDNPNGMPHKDTPAIAPVTRYPWLYKNSSGYQYDVYRGTGNNTYAYITSPVDPALVADNDANINNDSLSTGDTADIANMAATVAAQTSKTMLGPNSAQVWVPQIASNLQCQIPSENCPATSDIKQGAIDPDNVQYWVRVMRDSCTNQYILPMGINYNFVFNEAYRNNRFSWNESICQPLVTTPAPCNLDLVDNPDGSRCFEDLGSSDKLMYDYRAWGYLERAWQSVLYNSYMPASTKPNVLTSVPPGTGSTPTPSGYISLPNPIKGWESYGNEAFPCPLAGWTGPCPPPKTAPAGWPSQLTYPPTSWPALPPALGTSEITYPNKASSFSGALVTSNNLAQRPYERIWDSTHPFSPRWDMTGHTDRDLSSQTILYAPTAYATSRLAYPPSGCIVRCASVPVDILTFRADEFNNCMTCRIQANLACFTQELEVDTAMSIAENYGVPNPAQVVNWSMRGSGFGCKSQLSNETNKNYTVANIGSIENASSAQSTATGNLSNALGDVSDALGDASSAISDVQGAISDATSTVSQAVGQANSAVSGFLSNAISTIENSGVATGIEGVAAGVASTAESDMSTIGSAATSEISSLGTQAKGGVSDLDNDVKNSGSSTADKAQNSLATSAGKAATGALSGIQKSATTAVTNIENKAQNDINEILSGGYAPAEAEAAISAIAGAAGSQIAAVANEVATAVNDVNSTLATAQTDIATAQSTIATAQKTIATVQSIKSGATSIVGGNGPYGAGSPAGFSGVGVGNWPPCSTQFDSPIDNVPSKCSACLGPAYDYANTTDHLSSVTKCCADLAQAVAPINTLKIRNTQNDTGLKDSAGNLAEGYAFSSYFGNHMPYMRWWDTGQTAGNVVDLSSVGLGTLSTGAAIPNLAPAYLPIGTNYDPFSDHGQYDVIVGVGSEATASASPAGVCRYGGGAGKPYKCINIGGVNSDGSVIPDRLTSWYELKQYQMNSMRDLGMNCLPMYEKIWKPMGTEDGALTTAGRQFNSWGPNPNDLTHSLGQLNHNSWPLRWRGYLSDAQKVANRFPSFDPGPHPGAGNVPDGLDNAQIGDIIYITHDDQVAQETNSANDQPDNNGVMPFMAVVVGVQHNTANTDIATAISNPNADLTEQTTVAENCALHIDKNHPLDCSSPVMACEDNIQIIDLNNGKYPDVCGNTDYVGFGQTRTIYKEWLPLPLQNALFAGPGIVKRMDSCNEIHAIYPTTLSGAFSPIFQPLTLTANGNCMDPKYAACSFAAQTSGGTSNSTVNPWNKIHIYRPSLDERGE